MIEPSFILSVRTEVFMILVFTAIISLVVSLATSIVFFCLTKKRMSEKQVAEPVIEEEKEDCFFYSSEPIKDYTLNNFFTDDPSFIEKMKSLLDNYSSNSPIILRGPTGVGKTHLMHAFENYLLEKNPSLKTYFVSAESFTNEYIESIKNYKSNKFKEKYRNLDALFIDDLNFLRKKEGTQEELFYTISELLKKKAFICFGLYTPFSLKEGFSDRLVNLINGIQIDLPAPGFEAKHRKITQIFSDAKCYVNEDIVDYLAMSECGFNELVGLCKKLILMKQLEDKGCVNLKIEDIKSFIEY